MNTGTSEPEFQRCVRTLKAETNAGVLTITTDIVPKGEARSTVFHSRIMRVITQLEHEVRLMTDEQVASELEEIKRRCAAAKSLDITLTPTNDTKP